MRPTTVPPSRASRPSASRSPRSTPPWARSHRGYGRSRRPLRPRGSAGSRLRGSAHSQKAETRRKAGSDNAHHDAPRRRPVARQGVQDERGEKERVDGACQDESCGKPGNRHLRHLVSIAEATRGKCQRDAEACDEQTGATPRRQPTCAGAIPHSRACPFLGIGTCSKSLSWSHFLRRTASSPHQSGQAFAEMLMVARSLALSGSRAEGRGAGGPPTHFPVAD